VIALSLCYLGFDRAMTKDIDDDAAVFVAGLGFFVTT